MPTRSTPAFRPARWLMIAAISILGGCSGYAPGGSGASNDEYTYQSTADTPKTVKLVDWTTNTTIWTLDIPAGKQLVIHFYEDHDVKNTTRPTLMRWVLFENGRQYGELHNAIPAPDQDHRVVRVEITKHPVVPPPESASR